MKNRKLHRVVAALLVCMMLVSMIPAIATAETVSLGSPLPIASAECESSHSYWGISYLTNGNYASDFWSSGDGVPEQVDIVLTLEKASNVGSLILYPRQQGVAAGGARNFPRNFEILTSADGSTWTSVLTKTDDATEKSEAVLSRRLEIVKSVSIDVSGKLIKANEADKRDNSRSKYAEYRVHDRGRFFRFLEEWQKCKDKNECHNG